MIQVDCEICGDELEGPGGLMFSPPNASGSVKKHHVCVACWSAVSNWVLKAPRS